MAAAPSPAVFEVVESDELRISPTPLPSPRPAAPRRPLGSSRVLSIGVLGLQAAVVPVSFLLASGVGAGSFFLAFLSLIGFLPGLVSAVAAWGLWRRAAWGFAVAVAAHVGVAVYFVLPFLSGFGPVAAVHLFAAGALVVANTREQSLTRR